MWKFSASRAWDDIFKSLIGFFTNGDFGMWYQRKGPIIACCTDGTRPVIFKIEKIVEEERGDEGTKGLP